MCSHCGADVRVDIHQETNQDQIHHWGSGTKLVLDPLGIISWFLQKSNALNLMVHHFTYQIGLGVSPILDKPFYCSSKKLIRSAVGHRKRSEQICHCLPRAKVVSAAFNARLEKGSQASSPRNDFKTLRVLKMPMGSTDVKTGFYQNLNT